MAVSSLQIQESEQETTNQIAFPWVREPFRLWSLIEMLEANANEFVNVMDALGRIRHACREGIKPALPGGGPIGPQPTEVLTEYLGEIRDAAQKVGATFTYKQVGRILTALQRGNTYGTFDGQITLLHTVYYDEIEEFFALVLNANEAALYTNPHEKFSARVLTGPLAGASTDMSEACKCLALNRGTGAVFHLMRVMELSIRAWANKLQIPLSRLTTSGRFREYLWQEIEQPIQDKIESMPISTELEKKERRAHMAAIINFGNVREAWRNPTMHPDHHYTPEQASAILGHVAEFSERLTDIL